MAVWEQLDGTGTRLDIYGNYYSTTWGGPGLVETDNAGDALDAHVSIDGNGVPFAVWTQSDGALYNIKSNRYVSSSWGTAEFVETDSAGDAIGVRITTDSSGNAIAVWSQLGSDGFFNTMANRYTTAGGWGSAGPIESGDGDASNARIAMDGSGGAFAMWFQDDGLGTIHTWANQSVDGSVWGTAALLESDNSSPNNLGLDIAVDMNSGNAIAVWSQLDTSDFLNKVWANAFD
jgi:hypothetical protein